MSAGERAGSRRILSRKAGTKCALHRSVTADPCDQLLVGAGDVQQFSPSRGQLWPCRLRVLRDVLYRFRCRSQKSAEGLLAGKAGAKLVDSVFCDRPHSAGDLVREAAKHVRAIFRGIRGNLFWGVGKLHAILRCAAMRIAFQP